MNTRVRRTFRSDIQGMRAIAVMLVVLYHSGVTVLSGGYAGVDVFFVVSGFLITGNLLDSLERNGRINFGDFYAKRVRRILPASLVVLVLTVIAAFLFIPPLQMQNLLRDALATAAYLPNMWFAVEGTNYLAETAPSAFQHYWSLGVEEQFYLFWPAILGLGFLLVRKSRTGLFVLVAVIVAASFLFGLWLTTENQPWAFFSLPSRAWELGVGGLLAFLLSRGYRWLQGAPAALLGWAGVAGLIAVALLFDETTVFPGVNAALPVLASAAVIIGGTAAHPLSPVRVLSIRPMQYLGKISYSLYLVHWPLLVIPEAAFRNIDPLQPMDKLILGALSIPIAALLYTFVEDPARRAKFWAQSRPARSIMTGGIASIVVLVLAGGSLAVTSQTELSSGRTVAAAAGSGMALPATEFVPDNLQPSLTEAEDDNPSIYATDCHLGFDDTDPAGCLLAPNADAPRVVLFGDSHAAQWYPALEKLAQEGQIQLDSNTKSSCPSVTVELMRDGSRYTECDRWRDGVIDRLVADPPALVLLTNYGQADLVRGDDRFSEEWGAGLEATVAALPDTSKVGVISDSPDMGETPAICLSSNLDDATACGRTPDEAINHDVRSAEQDAAESAGASYVDLLGSFCDDQLCPAVLGDTLVYRDSHHITATFSAGLSPVLGEQIQGLLAAQ
ncbi:acyltransferase family protein [Salinibacterium sp. ZJ450]|uniref:acyltransferase family protein n=1 Tax=Salinibacterium sp. ZJ450 TaxID=2708338 RepID=UPI0014229704|nr:acyltransferase family protein [Salinibacterium sp. ZJ450]